MSIASHDVAAQVEELLHRIFHPHLRPRHKPAELELTLGQIDCLNAISRFEAPSMTDLAHELGLPASSVTGMVDKLVAMGKVGRESDPNDRRVVRVKLTPKGREDRERHRALRRKRLGRLLGKLNEEELQALQTALELIARAADRSEEDQS